MEEWGGGCTSHENDTILTEAGAAATGGLFVFVLVPVSLSQRRYACQAGEEITRQASVVEQKGV
jgi:hypothetical protein